MTLNLNRGEAALDFLDSMIEASAKDTYSYRRDSFIELKEELLGKIDEEPNTE